jgi:hypothetical protein
VRYFQYKIVCDQCGHTETYDPHEDGTGFDQYAFLANDSATLDGWLIGVQEDECPDCFAAS